jgi:hypothetical protein
MFRLIFVTTLATLELFKTRLGHFGGAGGTSGMRLAELLGESLGTELCEGLLSLGVERGSKRLVPKTEVFLEWNSLIFSVLDHISEVITTLLQTEVCMLQEVVEDRCKIGDSCKFAVVLSLLGRERGNETVSTTTTTDARSRGKG